MIFGEEKEEVEDEHQSPIQGSGNTLGAEPTPRYESGGLDGLIGMVEITGPIRLNLKKIDNWAETSESSTKPVVIKVADVEDSDSVENMPQVTKPIVIRVPPVEEYNPKAVHWDYGTGEIDAVMRSGRCYPPREAEPEKREVSKEDAEKLLSIVKTSEYEIVEQLRKLPAQISLLDLFINSEKHKKALMKVLNETHVPETIDETQLEGFVSAILLKDQISFSDEDFPAGGRAHNKALHIAVKCHGKQVSHVLVDNGSAFNICPLAILKGLGINEELMRTSKATIRAFDGLKRAVVGEIELDVFIGPTKFSIDFQVMDLPSAFGLLLGRPWIHTAGAVPSSLHQKVRFVVDNKIITVHGETDIMTYQKSAVPYIEPEMKEEASYHSLDLVAVVHTPVGTRVKAPAPTDYTLAPGKMLLAHGFIPGKGLGKHGQGIPRPLQLSSNDHRIGLGYTGKPNHVFLKGGYHGRRGRGRNGRGGRGSPFIGSNIWKGKAKMFDNPLNQVFSRYSKWLADEVSEATSEPDLYNPFQEDTVNVIFEWLTEESARPE